MDAWLAKTPLGDLVAVRDALHSLIRKDPTITNAMFADLQAPLQDAITRLPRPT